ncbi:MAG TPA: DegT/DnrJ/EryC1/StrS family aminotransferase [Terriglobia bacterium]|nr:DegT/DnrJ/EryC1/StrS family aminotransferase [Terriglobia bacterium]
MKVPYFDLKTQYADLRDEILAAVDRVCGNASFILGEEVASFEREFAAYCETKYCVALNSGTSALHLALLAAGVGPGDEVITTANTFIATAEAISYTGALPVFVDIDPMTANIDPSRIEQAITSRTKAILPVHLYGRPADIDSIAEIARRYDLTVIEDACQAHGARYHGRRAGSLARAAAFSFYPGKNLGAYGEGGALTTNDEEIAQFARTLRDHGQTKRYFHDFIGYNYRMDGFQGAVLRVKLKRLDEWTAKRQHLASLYRNLLTGAPMELPQDDPGIECAYHLFVAYVDDRDGVRDALEARGIQTAIHYPRPVHLQRPYATLGYEPGSLPHTERACNQVLSLPLFPEMTAEQVRYVAEVFAEVMEETSGVEQVSL